METLNLQDSSFSQHLISIIDQVEESVWNKAESFPLFTKHGKDEYQAISSILKALADCLPAENRLTDKEKFILLSGTALCNIGLRSPEIQPFIKGSSFEELDEELYIRLWETHPYLSYKMIQGEVSDPKTGKLLPHLDLGADDPLLSPIAHLVRLHEGDDKQQAKSWPGLEDVRFDLLIAMLQLANQLSFNKYRVNLQRLYSLEKPAIQSRFWPYQYFLGPIFTKTAKTLQLNFQIPTIYDKYSGAMRVGVENKIRNVYAKVISVFSENQLNLELLESRVDFTDAPIKYPIPSLLENELSSLKVDFIPLPQISSKELPADNSTIKNNVLALGELLGGRYEIKEIISTPQTSNSFVYVAEDMHLERRKVVIKDPAFFTGGDDFSSFEYQDRLTRYRREVRILINNTHPFIVKVYDFVMDRFLVEEWVEGRSLRQFINDKIKLPVKDIIQLGIETCDAMSFLQNNIETLHRDIKPDHLFVKKDGHLCLIDFGIAKEKNTAEFQENKTSTISGTWAYMAPEQFKSLEDVRSDIFSLGVTLYEALAWNLPYPRSAASGDYYTSMQIPFPKSLHQIDQRIPLQLDKTIMRAIAIDSEERYSNWQEFREALQEVLVALTQFPVENQQERAIPDGNVKDMYQTLIVALLGDKHEPIGTGFLVTVKNTCYVVTCAHILVPLGLKPGDLIYMEHFDPELGVLSGEIVHLNFPASISPDQWSARQDVCVIKVSIDWNWPDELSIAYRNIPQSGKCFCFGYVISRRSRGAFIEDIYLVNQVPKGFVELNQQNKNPDATYIEEGASGAPLCNAFGVIVGMVQAAHGRRVSYLIPSSTIQEILASL